MTSFSAQFRQLSNEELFLILKQAGEYQPEAVDAAQAELEYRQLPREEWQRLQEAWIQAQEDHWQRRLNSPVARARQRSQQFLDRFNPFHREGIDRDLLMIRVSTFFILVFSLIFGLDNVRLLSLLDLREQVLLLAPFLLVPLGLYLLHRRDPMGWIVLCAWTVNNLWILGLLAFQTIRGRFVSELPFFFRGPDPATLLVGMLTFGSMFYALNRRPVRETLRIDTAAWVATIVLALLFSALIRYA